MNLNKKGRLQAAQEITLPTHHNAPCTVVKEDMIKIDIFSKPAMPSLTLPECVEAGARTRVSNTNAVSTTPSIIISHKYRLAHDAHAWMLQEHVTRKHRRTGARSHEWRAIRWYGSLQTALGHLPEFCLRVMGVPDTLALGQARQAVIDALMELGEAYRMEIKNPLLVQSIGKEVDK